jgi:endonuclease-3
MVAFRNEFPFDFVIMVGDNIIGADAPADIRNKFEMPYKPLLDAGVVFQAALGNHDNPNQRLYKPFNMGGQRYYTFRASKGGLAKIASGGVRFFALDSTYVDALQLAVATILSAQCTDKRVNMVTPALFARYPDAPALAVASQDAVEAIIHSTGFFRNKAKSIIGMAKAIVMHHAGRIPQSIEELVALPGIGRKTANVILGNAFGMNEGVVVDTHVARLGARLGLTRATDPVKIEQALMPLFPRDSWAMLSHLLIWHGRRVCDAKNPRCAECVLRDICPSVR